MTIEEPKIFIDISPVLSNETAVFPGDKALQRTVSMTYEKGDPFELSSVESTLHVGSHLDSFNHFHPEGISIDQQNVARFLGPCQVIDVQMSSQGRIFPSDLAGSEILQKRVLLKTGSFPDPNQWNADFSSLSPELVDFLADKGVILVGIDTPSVDPSDSKKLESHQQLFKRHMSNLEGIVLEGVDSGEYMLSCMPLKLKGCEASPVRAVLFR